MLRKEPASIKGLLWTRVKDRVTDVLPRVLRVALVLALCFSIAGYAIARRARADVQEIMLGVGAQMMHFDGADHHDAPRALYLNGQQMMLATASTHKTVDEVLDYYEARCRNRDGDFNADIERAVTSQHEHIPAGHDDAFDTTLRHNGGRVGFVACLDTGHDHLTMQQLLDRIRDFTQTGDVASVGHLRYAYVDATGQSTHVVTFWTEHHLNVRAMFPRSGDAPGRDVIDVPRPPSSRRFLSAWEDGYAQSITLYAKSSANEAGLRRFYTQTLPHNGWTILDPSRARSQRARPNADVAHVLAAERGDQSIFLVLGEDEEGHGTTVVLTSR